MVERIPMQAVAPEGTARLVGWLRGTDPEAYAQAGKSADLPTNHNPRFAPVIHPTLESGVEAMVVAFQAWLSP